jgi:hypothetical protein
VTLRLFTSIALCLAFGVGVGCGSDDEKGAPIPADSAAALEEQLAGIQSRLDVPGACNDITGGDDPNTAVVNRLIRELPGNVDEDVAQALRDGFDRLFQLVEERCAEDSENTQTDTPPAETETEETTPTVEIPTETEETVPTETQPEDDGGLPPGQDGTPPGQDGESEGQGGGGGAIVPEDGE